MLSSVATSSGDIGETIKQTIKRGVDMLSPQCDGGGESKLVYFEDRDRVNSNNVGHLREGYQVFDTEDVDKNLKLKSVDTPSLTNNETGSERQTRAIIAAKEDEITLRYEEADSNSHDGGYCSRFNDDEHFPSEETKSYHPKDMEQKQNKRVESVEVPRLIICETFNKEKNVINENNKFQKCNKGSELTTATHRQVKNDDMGIANNTEGDDAIGFQSEDKAKCFKMKVVEMLSVDNQTAFDLSKPFTTTEEAILGRRSVESDGYSNLKPNIESAQDENRPIIASVADVIDEIIDEIVESQESKPPRHIKKRSSLPQEKQSQQGGNGRHLINTKTVTVAATERSNKSSPDINGKKASSVPIAISLVSPSGIGNSKLSDYNHLLTQNIEFFIIPEEDDTTNSETSSSTINEISPHGTISSSTSQNVTTIPKNNNTIILGRMGLRCRHCTTMTSTSTASSFFPRAISSLSSGLGTIAARHLIGEKCPAPSTHQIANELKALKKTSAAQTRNRLVPEIMSLDAYCRYFAEMNGLSDATNGRIYFDKAKCQVVASSLMSPLASCDKDRVKGLGMLKSVPISNVQKTTAAVNNNDDEKDNVKNCNRSSFVLSNVQFFWECQNCNSIPYPYRAAGSVIFGSSPPLSSCPAVRKHLLSCRGTSKLPIPRTSIVKMSTSLKPLTIKIKWDSSNHYDPDRQLKRCRRRRRSNNGIKTHRKRRRKTSSSLDKNDGLTTNASHPIKKKRSHLKPLDDKPLVLTQDQHLTTAFTFLAMMQLKMTRLSHSDRSRDDCPIGYPGLACQHCCSSSSPPPGNENDKTLTSNATTTSSNNGNNNNNNNERKFFFTTADHLRNSFTHIPTHLMRCPACPDEVKQQLMASKLTRSEEYSQLELGSHKTFIDTIWKRLHDASSSSQDNSDDGSSDDDEENNNAHDGDDESHDDNSISSSGSSLSSSSSNSNSSSLSSSHNNDPSSNNANNNSTLVAPEDEPLVTRYHSYTMKQMIPCRLLPSEHKSRGAFGVGFPGLACRYCASQEGPQGRTFFYRTSDILSGNYSHIPNHLLTCRYCPSAVKREIKDAKARHVLEKGRLDRGSQKIFFARVWKRLHGK